jgi:hypothetical protein
MHNDEDRISAQDRERARLGRPWAEPARGRGGACGGRRRWPRSRALLTGMVMHAIARGTRNAVIAKIQSAQMLRSE